jgi:hypothetical protein
MLASRCAVGRGSRIVNLEQSLWVILVDQPEHPGKHVVRRHELPMKTPEPLSEQLADSLEAARALLPPGVVKANRSEREDPVVVEIWMYDPRESWH